MPFRDVGPLRLYQFESMAQAGVVHAIFTRRGGTSPAPWRSLNVGGTVGDVRERVVENRRRCFAAVGRAPESIHDVWQVHSADVVHARAPRGAASPVQADGLICGDPSVTLFMRFADCVPVLLFDPTRRVVGMVHAGWLGTARRAVSACVQAMVRSCGCRPEDLLAGIGPSIGPDHYPVGDEVIEQVRAAFGLQAEAYLVPKDGRVHFDLWSANRGLLEDEGVRSVEVSGICTACHPLDWFSHRGEHGRTGRFGGLIGLEG